MTAETEAISRKRKRDDSGSKSDRRNVKPSIGTGYQKSERQQIQVQASPISNQEPESMFVKTLKRTQVSDMESYRVKEIEGGDVFYIEKFVDVGTATTWLEELTRLSTWYHPKLKVYGKEVNQSRSIAAYANDPKITVKYSGHNVELHNDYPPLLQRIESKVEDVIGESFNHVMLNRYESGKEYIGKHRDTKENKIIVSLSLGAERTFIMHPSKSMPGVSTHKWKLANGSLLIMRGATQDLWKHEIPREPQVKDERISLTFRQLHVPSPKCA